MLDRILKLALGAVTILPGLYMAGFMGMMAVTFATFSSMAAQGSTGEPPLLFRMFDYLFAMHLGIMALSIALLVFYISDIFRNRSLPEGKRALWALVVFMGGPVGMPIYWYYYVWQSPRRTA